MTKRRKKVSKRSKMRTTTIWLIKINAGPCLPIIFPARSGAIAYAGMFQSTPPEIIRATVRGPA